MASRPPDVWLCPAGLRQRAPPTQMSEYPADKYVRKGSAPQPFRAPDGGADRSASQATPPPPLSPKRSRLHSYLCICSRMFLHLLAFTRIGLCTAADIQFPSPLQLLPPPLNRVAARRPVFTAFSTVFLVVSAIVHLPAPQPVLLPVPAASTLASSAAVAVAPLLGVAAFVRMEQLPGVAAFVQMEFRPNPRVCGCRWAAMRGAPPASQPAGVRRRSSSGSSRSSGGSSSRSSSSFSGSSSSSSSGPGRRASAGYPPAPGAPACA